MSTLEVLVPLRIPCALAACLLGLAGAPLVAHAAAPILLVTDAADPFTAYTGEILRAEGFTSFETADASLLDETLLAPHRVVVLGATSLSPAQGTALEDWVEAGGRLVALRPDPQLAPLLGLGPPAGSLADAYLAIDGSAPPGAGLVTESIQFHGEADLYAPAGATVVATLWSDAATPTAHPAVVRHAAGSGQAAAFTYDLARSVVFTRQGNPAWAGQERDGFAPIRPDDLFFPDYVDLDKVAIPQADEQMRLLSNLLVEMTRDVLPLPRFWYFPGDDRAVVVLTGDEHGCCGGTRARFEANVAASAPGCSVEDWECVRSTSYVYPSTEMSDTEAQSWTAQGFELALHVNTNCNDWTVPSLTSFFTTQLGVFASTFPGVAAPATNRTHCIVWSDWAGHAQVEGAHGIRLDTNYYYWPPDWVNDRPGFFTGSGLPMRFADLDGTAIDVFQATTQMTDESGQSYPATPDALLDRALGPFGYYGAFTANAHTDQGASALMQSIVASAQARDVPVVSARQMLEWVDAREASALTDLAWDGSTLAFSATRDPAARRLRILLPAQTSGGVLTSLTRDGAPVAWTVETRKGVAYAIAATETGDYEASYEPVVPPDPVCLADAGAADFAAGSAGAGARVAEDAVVLESDIAEDFDADGLPAGWSSVAWGAGGGGAATGGSLVVDGARTGTDAVYPAGRTLEFVATFAPVAFQHVGFGVTYEDTAWAIFSTGNDGASLRARTFDGGGSTDTTLAGLPLGVPHRFRIEWGASSVSYFVDGAPVAQHARAVPVEMRPLASDASVGGATLVVDWLRLSPYAASGSFSSRIGDAGVSSDWSDVRWDADVPAGAALGLFVRAGETPDPDPSWSAWTPIAAPGDPAGVAGRYAQYRADLSTTDPGATPRLLSAELACAPVPPACSNGVDNDGDGRVDFPDDRGCASPDDPTEQGDCDDGIDNDGDGFTDFPDDRSCFSRADTSLEQTQCDNGLDDDGDGHVDWPADPQCANHHDDNEAGDAGCGLGAELIALALLALRRRRRATRADAGGW